MVREIEHTFADGFERPGFRLVHYSLQDDHAHLIVEARDRGALGAGMKSVAARLAPRVAPPGDSGRRAVARARSWLLTVGWRRHRLVDLDERPGSPR